MRVERKRPFAAEYFANLTEHFPTNNANNCGYVAAAMLLSYYDTYWNGSIIPNWFNNPMASRVHLDDSHYSSPGVNDFYAPVWTERNPRMVTTIQNTPAGTTKTKGRLTTNI